MIDVLAWGVVAVTAPPVLMFAAECLAGAAPHRAGPAMPEPPPFAVLVPAHNEAAGIAATIAAACAQLRSEDRLIVVADNCSDATATIARGAGAEVVERFSDSERGKGFALAAGRAGLATAPPAAVIVLDADCRPEPGALPLLASHAATHAAAVQGRNLLADNGDDHPSARISLFAFVTKNLVRQRGLQRFGSPALLQGTGMAFAWPLFERARLASGCLAEDMELGLALVLEGAPVRFVPEAGFHSPASSRTATVGQRTRWEHGAILTGWRHVPRLLAAGMARPALLLLALDLIIPPLALLAMLLAAATLVLAGLALLGAGTAPLLTELGLGGMFTAAVGYAWHRAGRDYLGPATLLRVPGYVLWKLPIYRRLLVDRQRSWVRTGRDA